jgi:ribosome-associated protein
LLLEKKAIDVLILDVRGKTSYADYFVIASGESERQVSAMAEYVEETLRRHSVRPLGVEGQQLGSWVLLDFGEVVAHLFFSETRAFYDLEGLWADVPREKVA